MTILNIMPFLLYFAEVDLHPCVDEINGKVMSSARESVTRSTSSSATKISPLGSSVIVTLDRAKGRRSTGRSASTDKIKGRASARDQPKAVKDTAKEGSRPICFRCVFKNLGFTDSNAHLKSLARVNFDFCLLHRSWSLSCYCMKEYTGNL